MYANHYNKIIVMKEKTCHARPVFIFFISLFLIYCSDHSIAQIQKNSSIWDRTSISQEYIPGVVVMKIKEGIGPFEQQKSSVSFGISSLDEKVIIYKVNSFEKRFKHKPIPRNSGLPDLGRIYKIEFPKVIDVLEVAMAFAADPSIEYAEPMYLGKFTEIPDDPFYNSQQHLPQIMAPEAWDIHKGEDGEEVVVAIVDTGTDWLHPDLTENTWQNLGEDADGDGVTLEYNGSVWMRDPDDLNGIDDDGNGYIDDVIGWDFHEDAILGDGSNPDPLWNQGPYEHGTHCSGISSGRTNNGVGISSVSWNIKYMPVQTDNGNNTVLYGIDGVIYAAENGADIISNSWYHGYGYSQSEYEAMQYAIGLGSIVCFAAANDNTANIALPAGYPGVISVAAVNSDDTRASFSNYGIAVDIAAPGVSILSTITNNGYASWGGTSMATPMVAGMFGLVKSYHPEWTNEELINQVIGTADDIDGLNAGFENMLGDGRINAYHALVDENVVPQQELKLEFLNFSLEDENGNGMLEPDESVTVTLEIQNFSQLVSSDAVTFTLSTFDQDITIISGSNTVTVPADAEFIIEDIFEFTINENATSHFATLFIEVSADISITYGQEFQIGALIAPSGFFVWDGEINTPGYSGEYINQFLDEQGYEVLYSNYYPHSFIGFDAIFLSFGNGGESGNQAVLFQYIHSIPIQEYLESGGFLYIEGMAILGLPGYFGYPNSAEWIELFGVNSVSFPFISNPISSLEGQVGTFAEGMLFTESNQSNNWYIDKVIPGSNAHVPFYEDNYGNVSIYNEGNYGQKTFYFGYSLSDLADVDPLSSRYNFLINMMDFFGYPQGDDYVIANFQVDETEILPGDEIQFTDFSISDEGYTVNSWAWDFNEDGEIDSDEQNPVWDYSTGGNYDVMLIVSNGQTIDTLIRNDLIMVRSGIFVFEGEENGVDQSGTFIRNYLQENGYETVYANHFPSSLIGFDAFFASFGSGYYSSPHLSDAMANTIKTYLQQGGNAYLEGSEALGIDQAGNNLLWFLFGNENVGNGTLNTIDLLQGQEGTIMEGLEFNSSNQLDMSSIDIYETYPEAPSAKIAFIESDYGAVAVQFDGTDFFNQKTFCMSYSLANLEDGEYPSTRNELLQRVLDFFNIITVVDEAIDSFDDFINVYPNPASNNVMFTFNLEDETPIRVEFYNLIGQKVMIEPDKIFSAGRHTIHLETKILPAGTYFYSLITPTQSHTGKLLIIK